MTQTIDYKINDLKRKQLLYYLRFYKTRQRKMHRVFIDLIFQIENHQSITPPQFNVIIPFLKRENGFQYSSDNQIREYFKILIRSKFGTDLSHIFNEPEYTGSTLEPFFS
jgi:hypothetical protein